MTGPDGAAYWLIGAGGTLLAISTILPWVNVIFIGDLSLFRLAGVAHSVEILPLAMVVAGVGLAVAAFRGAPIEKLALAAAITAGLLVLVGGSDVVDLIRAVHASRGLAGLGSGVYAGVIALILMGAGSVRAHGNLAYSKRKHAGWRPSSRVSESAPYDRAPGWKQDPWGVAGTKRYWDGYGWTREVKYGPNPDSGWPGP